MIHQQVDAVYKRSTIKFLSPYFFPVGIQAHALINQTLRYIGNLKVLCDAYVWTQLLTMNNNYNALAHSDGRKSVIDELGDNNMDKIFLEAYSQMFLQ